MNIKKLSAALGAAVLTIGLSACSNSGSKPQKEEAAKTANEMPVVYASTDVWASVARSVVGDMAMVETSIDNPNQDPHSYESSVKDKQLISQAEVVIVNGGGYDDWALQLAKTAGSTTIINAVELAGIDCESGEEHAHESGEEHAHHHHECAENEHVFYDLHVAKKVAKTVAETMSTSDRKNADKYTQNLTKFNTSLEELETQAQQIKSRGNKQSLATEPLAYYLLEEVGVHDITPSEYIEQSETEAGPSVKTQAETKSLLENKEVNILVVNGQTEDPISQMLKETAKLNDIPTITLNETLAGETDYVSWISSALKQLDEALV